MNKPLLLSIKDFGVFYGQDKKDWIIRDVNFELKSRQCLGLIGNNGSGKSTFAHALIGIIPHITPGTVKGELFFNKINLLSENISKRLQYIGYSFQDAESQILFGTVADVIGINERSSNNDFVNSVVDYLQIGHLLKKTPEQLSGGEAQKVALAAAIRCSPDVVLYDEATSALDPKMRLLFKDLVTFLEASNKAVLLLGQRYEMLSPYCEKIFLLKNGSITDINSEELKYQDVKINLDRFYDVFGKNFQNSEPPQLLIKDLTFQRRKSRKFMFGPVDLDIRCGDIIAVVGANGSGKTTLLHLLSGLLKPLSGKYFFNNKYNKFPIEKQLLCNIALVTQSPLELIIGATIREELDFANQIMNDSKKIGALLSHFPYLELEKDPLQLSYGQQRMLVMIEALLNDKPLLLIDEPEQGLDNISLGYIKEWFIKNRKTREKTVVFSTHDLDLAAEIADKCLLFVNGKITSQFQPSKTNNIKDWYFHETDNAENA